MIISEKMKQAIRRYLIENKTTQIELAEKLGLSKITVNNWLSGRTKEIKSGTWDKLKAIIPIDCRTIVGDCSGNSITNIDDNNNFFSRSDSSSEGAKLAIVNALVSAGMCAECQQKALSSVMALWEKPDK